MSAVPLLVAERIDLHSAVVNASGAKHQKNMEHDVGCVSGWRQFTGIIRIFTGVCKNKSRLALLYCCSISLWNITLDHRPICIVILNGPGVYTAINLTNLLQNIRFENQILTFNFNVKISMQKATYMVRTSMYLPCSAISQAFPCILRF